MTPKCLLCFEKHEWKSVPIPHFSRTFVHFLIPSLLSLPKDAVNGFPKVPKLHSFFSLCSNCVVHLLKFSDLQTFHFLAKTNCEMVRMYQFAILCRQWIMFLFFGLSRLANSKQFCSMEFVGHWYERLCSKESISVLDVLGCSKVIAAFHVTWLLNLLSFVMFV